MSAYLLRRSLYLENELEALHDVSWFQADWERLDTARNLSNPITAADRLTSLHGRITLLEPSWYLRNQLLRDWDWAGMAHSTVMRTPFDIDFTARLDPFIGSRRPPTKTGFGKTGIAAEEHSGPRQTGSLRHLSADRKGGLKPWADQVSRQFGCYDATLVE